MPRSRCVRIACDSYPVSLVTSDRRFTEGDHTFLSNAVQSFEMEMPMKKTSIRIVLLALGAAALSTSMSLSASADDNTPVTGGNGNCSTARDSAPNKHCLTKPKEGQKTGFDQFAEERAFLQAHPPTDVKVISNKQNILGGYHIWNDTVVITGPGYRIVNGVGSGLASGIGTKAGNGGSGGGRGTAAR